MEFIPSLLNPIDAAKPSLFELLSEQQLSGLLPPSLRYLLALATHRQPRYLLRVLNNFDEVYALLSILVEKYYLEKFGGSFTENFYELKREKVLWIKGGELPRAQLAVPGEVREKLKLGKGDVWKNLAVLVGLPYLKRKLDESYDVHIAPSTSLLMSGSLGGPQYLDRDALPPHPTLKQRFMWLYKFFLRRCYPTLNAAYYFGILAFSLAYLFDGTKYSSPFLWMIGTRMRRMGEADYKAIALADSATTPAAAGRPGQGLSGILNPRTIYPWLLSSLKVLLPTSIFALKFLEWWHASDFSRQLSRKAAEGLELPPPVVSGMTLGTSRRKANKEAKEKQGAKRIENKPEDQNAPVSSTTYLPIFTVPPPLNSDLCPICLHPISTAAACQTGYVYDYKCIFQWIEGTHERQEAFMRGDKMSEWEDEGYEEGDVDDESNEVARKSREGNWENGSGRCAVTGQRVLGGTSGLRRVMAIQSQHKSYKHQSPSTLPVEKASGPEIEASIQAKAACNSHPGGNVESRGRRPYLILTSMRGSAFRGYRGRKPGNPSCRNKQARLQDKHALFGPESFMKAVAATKDRQEFDRLMAPPKQPRQTSKQQKAHHENWRCSKSFFHPEDRPFAERPTPAEHSTSAENNVAPTTPAPLPAAWICPSYPKSLPLASSSTGVTSRVGSNNSSKSLTSLDQTEYQPSRRAAADQNPFMLLDLVPEAAQYSQPDSFAQKRSTKIPLTLRDTVAASTVSAENISTNTVTSFEQGTSAEHQSATADLDGHHPDISAKKATVVSVAATGNARKYDIPILKRLQPAHGGTGLHLAQKAALRMHYFLVPGPQSLFAYRAISVKHANSTAPHFPDQAQQPDHWETSTEIPADSAGDITASVDATEDDKEDSFKETESAKTIYEDENTADKARKGDTAEWAMTQNVALELKKDILQEETKEVIVDPFRWLLPANFQDAGSLHKC